MYPVAIAMALVPKVTAVQKPVLRVKEAEALSGTSKPF